MTSPRKSLLARCGLRLKAQLVAWATEKSTPARIALGFAAGIFIGIVPSFAIGSLIALYLASRLGLHQGAALSGTFLMNPVTAPLFYSLSYAVGAGFGGVQPAAGSGVFASVQQLGWAFLLGNAIVALSAAALFGLVLFFWVRRARLREANAKTPLQLPESAFPA